MNNDYDNLGPITDILSADRHITNKEYDEHILKMGAFVSILHNKKISPIQLYIFIAENKNLQDVIFSILGLDTFEQFTREYALRFPIIYKSKIVLNKLSKKNGQRNRKTKKHL